MTQIPYIDEHWGVVTGCSGQGCKCRDNCWARDMVRRFPWTHDAKGECHSWEEYTPFSTVQFHSDRLNKPLHWRKPRRIGVCFTGDIADNQVPYAWQFNIFSMVRRCPQHQFFFLTKQIFNLKDAVANWCHSNPWPANAWSGVSICDQEDADTKIPDLLRIPGHKWISVEPMLSAINIDQYLFQQCIVQYDGAGEEDWGYDVEPRDNGIEFAVIGCESGSKRRPCDQKAMTQLVTDLQDAFVPVWEKQIQNEKGRVIHDINLFPEALKVRQIPRQT